jgi:hypothetical protein
LYGCCMAVVWVLYGCCMGVGVAVLILSYSHISLFESHYHHSSPLTPHHSQTHPLQVFGEKSTVKLVTEHAFYDESALENLMDETVGDSLFLDSNQVCVYVC